MLFIGILRFFILRIKTFSSKYMITNILHTIETNTGHPTLQQIKENQKVL